MVTYALGKLPPKIAQKKDEIFEIGSDIADNIGENLGTIGAVVGAGTLVTVGGVALAKTIKKRKKSKKKSKKKTSSKRKLKFGSKAYRKKYLGKKRKQKKPYTAGKRKDKSHKRIRYTKNNQPYIIQANGRARFIKKSSVRRARKLKGGLY